MGFLKVIENIFKVYTHPIVMTKWLEEEIDYWSNDLFTRHINHVLFYGKRNPVLTLMKGVYTNAMTQENFLCSWHDATNINNQLDFFEPILKLKYDDDYTKIKNESEFLKLYAKKDAGKLLDPEDVTNLVNLCGQEKKSVISNARKLPVIFMDGIEELFFKMDFNLNKKDTTQLLSGRYMQGPSSNGFGNSLRNLHQLGTGIFYGIVRNKDSLAFKATLGNYHYLFNGENFQKYYLSKY